MHVKRLRTRRIAFAVDRIINFVYHFSFLCFLLYNFIYFYNTSYTLTLLSLLYSLYGTLGGLSLVDYICSAALWSVFSPYWPRNFLTNMVTSRRVRAWQNQLIIKYRAMQGGIVWHMILFTILYLFVTLQYGDWMAENSDVELVAASWQDPVDSLFFSSTFRCSGDATRLQASIGTRQCGCSGGMCGCIYGPKAYNRFLCIQYGTDATSVANRFNVQGNGTCPDGFKRCGSATKPSDILQCVPANLRCPLTHLQATTDPSAPQQPGCTLLRTYADNTTLSWCFRYLDESPFDPPISLFTWQTTPPCYSKGGTCVTDTRWSVVDRFDQVSLFRENNVPLLSNDIPANWTIYSLTERTWACESTVTRASLIELSLFQNRLTGYTRYVVGISSVFGFVLICRWLCLWKAFCEAEGLADLTSYLGILCIFMFQIPVCILIIVIKSTCQALLATTNCSDPITNHILYTAASDYLSRPNYWLGVLLSLVIFTRSTLHRMYETWQVPDTMAGLRDSVFVDRSVKVTDHQMGTGLCTCCCNESDDETEPQEDVEQAE